MVRCAGRMGIAVQFSSVDGVVVFWESRGFDNPFRNVRVRVRVRPRHSASHERSVGNWRCRWAGLAGLGWAG